MVAHNRTAARGERLGQKFGAAPNLQRESEAASCGQVGKPTEIEEEGGVE